MHYNQKGTYDQYGNPILQAPGYAQPVGQQVQYQQYDNGVAHVQAIKPEKPAQEGWRDLPFAILFFINVIAIAVLMVVYGIPLFRDDDSSNTNNSSSNNFLSSSQARNVAALAVALCAVAAALSLLLIRVVVRFASGIIQFSLWFSVAVFFAIAVLGFVTGNIILGIIGGILGLLALCYARLVQSRIPFATANLKTAAEAVKKHGTLHCVAFVVLIVQVVWIFLWSVAFLGITNEINSDTNSNSNLLSDGATCTSNSQCASDICAVSDGNTSATCQAQTLKATSGVAYFFMLVSFYWGLTVIKNISHVTVAGTIAAWWFHADSSGATKSALKRSVTTSLGSICLGSLIVAILKALRQLAEEAQREGDACACIAACILGCIESLIELFNKWAFVYVGIYGYKFTDAGRAVFTLFKQRGFDAIINDDLIGNVLGLTAFAIGLICAGLGVAFHFVKEDLTDFDNAALILGILGFFIGVGISIIPLSVIESAVATVFVCFAEDPAVFSQHHPELYGPLVSAWYALYPDIMAASGYRV